MASSTLPSRATGADDDGACDLDAVAEFVTEWACAIDADAMRDWAGAPQEHGAFMVAKEGSHGTPPCEREEGCSSGVSTPSDTSALTEFVKEQQEDGAGDKSAFAQHAKEIKQLRDEAKELSAKLVTLCAARDARTMDRVEESHKWTGWHAKAEKQRRRLMLAECENRDLKLDLKVEKDKAKSLRRILMKRAAKAACPKWSLSNCVNTDHDLFASMLSETESLVAKTNAVMQVFRQKVPCPARTGSFRDLREQYGDDDVVRVFLVDSEEMPFSKEHVERAMDAMLRTYEMDQFAQKRFNTSSNTIMSKAVFSLPSADFGVIYFRSRQTIWSFSNDAYSVFVSTMLVDPVTDTGEPLPGVLLKMQEWRVVSKGESGGTTLHQTFAVVSLSERPDNGDVPDDPCTDQQWQRYVPGIIQGVDVGFTNTNHRIETLLIEHASAASSRVAR